MTLNELFDDKTIKSKAKVAKIGEWLLNGELPFDDFLAFAEALTGANKATCIEALEYATKKDTCFGGESLLNFVTKTLKEEEPRVKWESAKVIGNIAKKFPDQLSLPIVNLSINADHQGSVVRWATVYALAEILKLKTEHNKKLLPQIEQFSEQEEDNGVRKKYIDALKKVKK